MFDKYDEKAQEFCTEMDDHDSPKATCPKCRDIAQALRSAAADAYEDAAEIASYGADYSSLLRSHVKEMTAKAKALRGSNE